MSALSGNSPPSASLFPPFGPGIARPSAAPAPGPASGDGTQSPLLAPFAPTAVSPAQLQTNPRAEEPARAGEVPAMPWEMTAESVEATAPEAAEPHDAMERGGPDRSTSATPDEAPAEDIKQTGDAAEPWESASEAADVELPAAADWEADADPAAESQAATPGLEANDESTPATAGQGQDATGDAYGAVAWAERDDESLAGELVPIRDDLTPVGDLSMAEAPAAAEIVAPLPEPPEVSEPAPAWAEPGEEADLIAVVEAAPVGAAPPTDPFADVASQLERIARSLRQAPDDFLTAPGADPLALLVTGFVLGYTRRAG